MKLSALNFSFTSSNHEIAEVDVNGIITVKKAGTAVVTAVYKDNPSMQVKWTVNKKEHSYRAIYWHDYTEYTCKSCYDSYREYNIAMTEQNVRLAATKVIYNGREQEPAVIVTDDTGNIVGSDNYSLTYTSNKNVGWGEISVDFQGKYMGNVSKAFQIVPKGTSVTKVTPKKKSLVVKWKKQTVQISGYEIQYALNSKFTRNKTKTMIVGRNGKSKKITGLKTRKKYYVRIRTYKEVRTNGVPIKFYSAWSKVKKVKTK